MKKKHLVICLFLLSVILAGCSSNNVSSSKSIVFTGESKNWKGDYTVNKATTQNDDGIFTFTYKKGENVVFKNLQVTIKADNSSNGIIQKEDVHNGSTIKVNNSSSGTSLSKADTIKVEIDWDNTNKETLLLKKN